ncbi:MAG TPA: hypothetical protein VK395_04690 [Gemmataceae bacterium]|nr:hypothetical protein [Gemmataceae bacterium]
MERSAKKEFFLDWGWFFAWGIASSLWCWGAAGSTGATFDEPLYVKAGLQRWRTGSHQDALRMGTMPLPLDVDTLPIYLWERWHGIRFDATEDLEQLLPWARAGTLVFWWLLLAYGRLGGRQIAGPWGGRLAVALLACEPSLLAHASLATTDLAITACLLAMVYHFRTGRDAGWGRRLALPMVWFAAAILAKASGMVFGPICLLVVELERFFSLRRESARNRSRSDCSPLAPVLRGDGSGVRGLTPDPSPPKRGRGEMINCPSPKDQVEGSSPEGRPTSAARDSNLLRDCVHVLWGGFRRDLVRITIGALVLVFLYCGCDWQTQPSFVSWAHQLPDGPGSRAMVWLADHLRIFSNAGEGLVRQVRHNMKGHATYLLGEIAQRAIWYYFPTVLSIKLSIPLLVLPMVVGLLRPRALLNWAFLAALALAAFSLVCRVQIGIRLILPLVGLGVVGLAAAAVNAYQMLRQGSCEPNRSGEIKQSPAARFRVALSSCLVLLLGASVLWTAAAATLVWPNGLCYANEFWGGTKSAYTLLSDSNYDWGQGLKELARWQQQHDNAPLEVWYFGTDPAIKNLPMEEVKLYSLAIRGPEDVRTRVRGHYLAVGITYLYGSLSATLHASPSELESYTQTLAFLSQYRPVDRTTTFLIYDFRATESDPDSNQAVSQLTKATPSDPRR